ncbi:MAG: hypothetical protein AN484_01245 [Aphanizomenon flos-aquae WA102]|uniref:Phage tail tape measure protein domain-containing protein n=1 Tax=Aphanizomenon flos-aquae WA102 TaxID=1710896 RepID=A0A1B7X8A6_APHFL|nr:MAG: hypothetical protein AN484_01245 [Aphanizomenon flos-aquae WA102]
MADVNSNININFDTTAALAQLRSLQAGLSRFHQTLAEGNLAAANAQKGLNAQLIQSVGATGKFSASQVKVAGSTLAFTSALEKNKLSLREYYRYTMAAATANTRVMGKAFSEEREIINRARRDRVKALQAQYIQMNKSNAGFMDAIRIMPKSLQMASGKFTELGTRIQYAAQKQQFLNQLLKQGSTQLLNFGKNTQWAGRQLMVGLTMPLALFGSAAAKAFKEFDAEVVKFRRVYGNAFTNDAEVNAAVENIRKLSNEYVKYGVSVTKTMEMAATAAAAGFEGSALTTQVETATKLAVLGQIEQQQALETTISLQTAFGLSSEDLAKKINFLNAVENQTLLSIEDLTIAIPKAAPVVKQLGGSVEDLAFFLTAMKEGGINASEGANALKSGLASLINPSDKAAKFLGNLGINVRGLVEANKGDIKGIVVGFARALDELDPLNRARAIEQMFGKFQFARLSTLFQNVTKDGSQASRAFQLAGASIEELAILSEREMKKIEDSTGAKFQAALENLKQEIMPLGKAFLEALTPVVKFFSGLLEKFNGLGDNTKKVIAIIVAAVAGLGPVLLMTFGLLMNGVANVIKLFTMLRGGIAKLNGQTGVMGAGFNYMTQEQIENAASSEQLHQTHSRLIQVFNVEKTSVNALAASYNSLSTQMRTMATQNPALFAGGVRGAKKAISGLPPVKKYREGVLSVPGPKGAGDVVPAMLSPGEAVIPTDTTNKYRGLISAMFQDKVPGFMAGRLPGGPGKGIPLSDGPAAVRKAQQAKYRRRDDARQGYNEPHPDVSTGPVFVGMPKTAKEASQSRQILDKISEQVSLGRFGTMPPSNFGTKLQGFKGYSFPERGIGGVYRKPNGKIVVVKPTIDEKTALAEVRMTQIEAARGMIVPKQVIRTMVDPTDVTGQRKFIVIESPYDPRIAAMDGKFTQGDMVKQLVGSTLRGDKDLQQANVSGRIVADVGNAGAFDRASGFRDYANVMPSMEEQAMINLLGIKGGAKKFFAQETASIAGKMTPQQYENAIKQEINQSIPRVEKLIKSWDLEPDEQIVYDNLLKRLKAGAKVDWAKFQPIHASAANGVIKAETGIGSGARPQEILEQLSKYEIASVEASQSKSADLRRSAEAAFRTTLESLDSADPVRSKIVKTAWDGGVVPVPPSGRDKSFAPRQTAFINELSRMTPIDVDGVTKYLHPDDLDSFRSDPDGRAKYARTKEQVINNVLYRMGAIPNDKGIFVDKGGFEGSRFASVSALKTDLRSSNKGAGGGRGVLSNIVRPEAMRLLDEYRARMGDPLKSKAAIDMRALGLTDAQIIQKLKPELSHISATGNAGIGGRDAVKFKTGTAQYDTFALNRYIGTGSSRFQDILKWNNGGNLNPLKLNPALLSEYKKAADFMATGLHPETPEQRSLVARAAELEALAADHKANGGKIPKVKLPRNAGVNARALLAILRDPAIQPSRMINLAATSADEVFVGAKKGESVANVPAKTVKKIGNKNSVPIPDNVVPVGKNGKRTSDNVLVRKNQSETITTPSQTRQLVRVRGFDKGDGKVVRNTGGLTNPTVKQGQLALQLRSKGYTQVEIDRALRRFAENELKNKQSQVRAAEQAARVEAARQKEQAGIQKKQTDVARKAFVENERRAQLNAAQARTYDAAVKENQRRDLKNQKQTEKANIKNQRIARQEKVGRFSGGASMALGTVGMGLMMSGNTNAGMAVSGLSALAGMAPMLAGMGPVGIALTAVAAVGGGLWMLDRAAKKAAEAQSKQVDATRATTEKMKAIGIMTGKVGASEIYARKRQESVSDRYSFGFKRGKSQFGSEFLKEQVGKDMMAGITKSLTSGSKNTASQVAVELAGYISDGILTAQQANSIADQIGIELGNTTMGADITGKLLQLVGPDGKDLLTNPLEVRVKLIQEQQKITKDVVNELEKYANENKSSDWIVFEGSNTSDGKSANYDAEQVKTFAAAAAASNIQDLEFSQAQIDSLNLEKDKKIEILKAQKAATSDKAKQLEIDGKIRDVEKDRVSETKALRSGNKKIMQEQLKAFKAVQTTHLYGSQAQIETAYFEGLKTQVREKYKDDPNQTAFLEKFFEGAKNAGSQEIEVKLNTLVGSGQMSVSTSVKLMEMFAGDEKGLNKVLNLTTSVADPGKVNEFINQVDTLTDPGTKKEIIVALTAMTPKESEKILSAFNLMKELNPEINIEFFFKDGGAAGIGKLQKIADKLEIVKNIDIPVLQFITETKEVGGTSLDGLNEIMEEYKNQPDFIHKVVLSQFIVLKETLTPDQINAEKKRMLAGYKGNPSGAAKYSEYLNTPEGTEAAKASYMKRGVAQAVEKEKAAIEAERLAAEQEDGGTKTDPFEWMLAALKNVRNAAIDAKGGIEELKRALAKVGPKSVVDKFKGIDQQLVAQGRNKQFIDFVMNQDPTEQAKYFTTAGAAEKSGKNKGRIKDPYNKNKFLPETAKQGDVVLSSLGKTYNNFFDAKVIGDFNAAMVRSLSSIKDQEKARIKLVAAGYDSVTIEGLLTDEYTTQLIASGKITDEELKQNVEISKELANRQKINSLLSRGTSELQRQVDLSRAAQAAKFLRSQGVSEDGVRAALADAGSLSEAIAAMDQYNSSAGLAAGTLKTIVDGLNAIKANSNIELIFKFATANVASQISQGADAAKKIMDSKRTVYNNLTAEKLKNATSSYVDASKPAQQVGKIATATVDARYKATNTPIPVISEGATIKSLQKAMETKAKEISLSSSNLSNAQSAASAVRDQISNAENALQAALDNANAGVDKAIKGVQDVIRGYENQIKSIEKTIKSREDQIKKRFTDKIEAFNKENQMLSNDLAIMDKAAEDINEKYDKQVEALQEVNKLNQEIIDSQGQQLDLADALSQGDIAAAARVANEMSASYANNQADTIMQGVELARTNDLSALTGAESGLTSEAISERQFAISQEIYKLETDPARLAIEAEILALNESILAVQELIAAKQEEIDNIEAGRANILAGVEAAHAANLKALNDSLVPLDEAVKKNADILKKLEDEEAALSAQEGYLAAIAEEAVAIDNTTGMTLEDWADTEDKVKSVEELAEAYAISTLAAQAAVAAASRSWGEILDSINKIPDSVDTKLIVEKIENITQNIKKTYTDDGSTAAANKATADAQEKAAKTTIALRKLQSGQPLTDEEKGLLGISVTKKDDGTDPGKNNSENGTDADPNIYAQRNALYAAARKAEEEEAAKKAAADAAKTAGMYDPTDPSHLGSYEDGVRLIGDIGRTPLRYMGYWADGGVVYRKGGSTDPEFKPKGTDTVPAMLTPGEFVVKKSAVKKYGSKFFKTLNDKKYPKKTAAITPVEVLDIIRNLGSSKSSKSETASTTPTEVLDIIRNLNPSLDIKPTSAYDSNNQPTGSPTGRYWGELERLYEGSPIGFDNKGKPIFNTTGKDPWGGTEIPGLPFSGKVANFSDYFHQLAEQPKDYSSPGMGIDKPIERYAGSGASMGGIGNGAYGVTGLQMLSEGGMAGNKNGNWFSRFNPVNAFSSMLSGMFNVGASKTFNTSTNIKSKITQQEKDYMALQTAQMLSGYTSAFNLKNKTSPEIFGNQRLGVLADVLGVLPGIGLGIRGLSKASSGAKMAATPKTTVYANNADKIEDIPFLDDTRQARFLEYAKSLNNKDAKTLSQDTIAGIKKNEAEIKKRFDNILELKTKGTLDGKSIEEGSLSPTELIEAFNRQNTDDLMQIALAKKYNIPPIAQDYLKDYAHIGATAFYGKNWSQIHTALGRQTLGREIVGYRGLSHKDLADIVGYREVNKLEDFTGKVIGKESAYEGSVGFGATPGATLKSNWRELLGERNEFIAPYDVINNKDLFDLEQGIGGVGNAWVPDTAKSFTESLDWAKTITTNNDTGGGGVPAIAKVNFGPDVLGIDSITKLGQGGTHADPTLTEPLISAFTEFILKKVTPMAHRIPDDTGAFVPWADGTAWRGGPGYSRYVDEYEFDAVRTLPKPYIVPERFDDAVTANVDHLALAERSQSIVDALKKQNLQNAAKAEGMAKRYGMSSGGLVPKYFAAGGYASGTDTIPAMLTPGEFVMSKYAVEAHGADTMKAINNGSSVGDSVYNYSISVNVKSDSNPDEIARAVMTQIKSIDSQKIRGVRV